MGKVGLLLELKQIFLQELFGRIHCSLSVLIVIIVHFFR